MGDEHAPRWRRLPERRPDQLLDAALGLLADGGYEATSVQQIARAADVSVGTVYRYFTSKEHLLDALHHRFHTGLEAAFDAAVRRLAERAAAGERVDAAVAAHELVDTITDFLRAHATACRVIATHVPRVHDPADREAHDRRFVDRLTGLLRAGVELGIVATTHPDMTAHLLYHGLRDSLTLAIAFDDPPDLDRLTEQAKEVVTRVLSPDT